MERGSLLQESERDVLESYNCYGSQTRVLTGATSTEDIPWPGEKQYDSNYEEPQAKHRIRNQVGSDLQDHIQRFRHDLEAVEQFYMHIQSDGWYQFTEFTLPPAVDEMIQLRDYLDTLITYAESERYGELRGDVADAFAPLSEDLKWPTVYNEGYDAVDGITPEDVEFEDGEVTAPAELVADKEEYVQRREALADILRNDGWLEMFEWVAEHEGEEVPDRKVGGIDNNQRWKQAIGQHLSTDSPTGNGLVKKTVWDNYEFTTRGERVHQACQALLSSSAVTETDREHLEDREVALRYLEKFFGSFP